MAQEHINIGGAREHNLKNINLRLPKDKLIVFTGVSGSGKSSLAFDTIYAEGQRRYIQSLSTYARQFLGQLEKPDVDFIDGLAPSISIDQKSTAHNPRSTVATVTEIYDYLRVLFARVGTPHCLQCGRVVGAQTADAIVDQIVGLPVASKILILAPIVSGRRGEYREELSDARKAGFVRVRIDGEVYDLMEDIQLDRNQRHDIELVVDRVVIKPEIRARVAEAVETSLRLGNGQLIVHVVENPRSVGAASKDSGPTPGDLLFSKDYTCVHCNISYDPPAPRHFSFNSPAGMCLSCKGLGSITEMSVDLVVSDPSKSISEGAIAFWGTLETLQTRHRALSLANHLGFSIDTPWEDLTASHRQIILYGSGKEKIPFVYRSRRNRRYTYTSVFEGVIPPEERKFFQTSSELHKRYLGKYMVSGTCPECHGGRLKPEVEGVTIGGKSILDVIGMTISESLVFFQNLHLGERDSFVATDLLKEIKGRIGFLISVGLHYLTLNRGAPSLSGGEAQRMRLASQVGAGLRGVIYVLDEPSIGLHPRDNTHLLTTLKHLRNQGNTVIVVEHDEDTMWAGDLIVDFGPGPGVKGGEIAGIGVPQEFIGKSQTLTAQYLRGEKEIEIPVERRLITERWLEIDGARQNNLKNITARIPVGAFTCVTGVSGSGKSSLINDILFEALSRDLMKAHGQPGQYKAIRAIVAENTEMQTRESDSGAYDLNGVVDRQIEAIGLVSSPLPLSVVQVPVTNVVDKVINIDQAPIGRTPRSNPDTYTKVFDQIRSFYSELADSKLRGYRPGRFSFNVSGGRCEACAGNGAKRVEMHLLADIWVECNVCRGRRYNDETLEVKYRGKTITDVLNMDVQEALDHFSNVHAIAHILQTLHDVGLDYIKLGQPAPTLSGGEAQRIKLARELAKRSIGTTLYILDEPTTGLHFDDVKKLLEVLHRLVDKGNTVVVVEHNLEVVKTADYLIDLGPEGGEEGGYVVACGRPEDVADVEQSFTGQALSKVLSGGRKEGEHRRVADGQGDEFAKALADRDERINAGGINSYRSISVHGAKEHNLKDVNVDIPHGKLTALTGVSGSGKTSLALDTIYAEGQRRYVESLSAYARQFLGQLEKPKVEKIEGLSPAIAIEQKPPTQNPRSTVATLTEIYDYLRVLYARAGTPHCPECGTEVGAQTLQQIVDKIASLSIGSRVHILSPLILQNNEDYPASFLRLRKEGYARLEINGEIILLDKAPNISKNIRHDVNIVIDRLVLVRAETGRLSEAVEIALNQSKGVVAVRITDDESRVLFFSQHSACLVCDISFVELTPRHFSFNSPLGQCSVCEGIGTTYNGRRICKECEGTRIQAFPRAVRLGRKTIAMVTAMSIGEASEFFSGASDRKNTEGGHPTLAMQPHQIEIAHNLLNEIQNRIQFLMDVGLHYLTLDRSAPTISGGEMERIRLASQLGSGLTGVTYVLDEPSIGLHKRDQARLLRALERLRDLDNSVLVVEHDVDTMLAADYIVDFGPGAGKLGGEVVSTGSPIEVQQDAKSLTGKYLSGELSIEVPSSRRSGKGEWLEIGGASTNNLKCVTATVPLGTLTCVTGVSGSGKSSLISGTLYPALAAQLNHTNERGGRYKRIDGSEHLDKLINIDQHPIGETPRSNPATYTDIFTKVRYLFAELPEAKIRGFDSRRFSFNLKVGQCENCQGYGYNRVEMHFLADVWVKCEMCNGSAYNHETLQIRYRGKNIAEVLEMTVEEALNHFKNVASIAKRLQMLHDVGLEYIQLGQAATTLSGGEAQRVKLARELAKRSTGRTIYIMDEPTTGLHFADVQKLLSVLNRLVEKGNTIIVIEHNLDVIKCADWVIDLGPEGGDDGGEIVAMGTPEVVAAKNESHTGTFLRQWLR